MKKGRIITVLGASSCYVAGLIDALITNKMHLEILELRLYDEQDQKEALNKIYQYAMHVIKKQNIDFKVTMHHLLEHALDQTDYIISYIGSTVTKSDLKDEKLLYKHKVLSSDLYGFKSMFKAIKIIPKLFEIIDYMNIYCEHAWFINLVQPMGLISEAIIRYAETDKYIGISHVEEDVNACFAQVLNVKEKQLIPFAIGISPMTFVTSIFKNQKDQMSKMCSDFDHSQACYWPQEFISEASVFPSTDLKYIYYADDETNKFIKQYEKNQSMLNIKKQQEEKWYKQIKNLDEKINFNNNDVQKKTVKLLKSLILDQRDYQIINTINNGKVEDFEDGCAIEVSARMTKDGPIPIRVSRLPLEIKGVLQHLKSFEQLFVDAIYLKDLNKMSLAMKMHPMGMNIRTIDHIFNEYKLLNEKQLKKYQKELV